jgi:hypothetical protein
VNYYVASDVAIIKKCSPLTLIYSSLGFDTHSNVEEHLSNRFNEANEGIDAFVVELKRMGVWNNVTTIQTSDFARTLNPNGGDGTGETHPFFDTINLLNNCTNTDFQIITDHAWGGNYLMFGGSVKGGKILGEYPDDLTDEGPLTLGRGRMIPSTPWDAVFKGIAGWLGVPNDKMNDVLPNLENFDSFSFDVDDMFGSVPPPPPPSPNPTPSPKTSEPTASPSKAPVLTGAPTRETNAPTKKTVEPTQSPTSSPNPTPSPKTPEPTASPSKAPVLTGAPTLETNAPIKEMVDATKSPSVVTSPTTSSPTSDCFDDDSYLFRRDPAKDCAWVAKKPGSRCWKYDDTMNSFISQKCKKTCATCSCNDEKWMFEGNPNKNCAWVKKKVKRCRKPGAQEHCRAVCGLACL